ncbi:MAG: hypothetical protein KAW12_18015 [Candidatus Aminicenantes bacterium]|nr:hypothetical protein [Candidatus Aminicenantes bacterium]
MKKKMLFLIVTTLFVFSLFLPAGGLEVLKIEESGEKDKLFFDLKDVQAIIAGFEAGDLQMFIEFADLQDKVLARLGKFKSGKIKWRHKIQAKTRMLVKFDKTDFPGVLEKLQANPMKPGFQVILSNSKTNEVLKSYEISSAPFADLAIEVKYPIKVKPGEELKEKITTTIRNTGAAPAGNFHVDFTITAENRPDIKLGSFLKEFSQDVVIKDGKETVGKLVGGADCSLTIDSLKIPADIVPGRYNMQVTVDSQDVIKEPDEENNVFKGFLIISVAEPKLLTLDLSETRLVFKPSDWGFSIMHGSTVLSDGKDWRKCRIKAHIYQIRHASWKDFHWEIDTFDRSVWRITGAAFCKSGGKAKELKIKVAPRGGSKTAMPTSVDLVLKDTKLEFKPATREFKLLSYGDSIAYVPFWQTCKLESHLYQFKNTNWPGVFWQADTFKKEVNKISEGKFCKQGIGGTVTPTKIGIKVEQ